MCNSYRELSRRNRILFLIANISLVMGLLLWNFKEPIYGSHPGSRVWVDAVAGFLLGLSITINLFGLRRARGVSQTKP